MAGDCPDEQDVLAFAAGKLTNARASHVERHLETCSTCAAVLASLDEPTSAPAREPDDLTREAEGRYELQRELGEGAEGRVWLAWDHHLGRAVALKLAHGEGERALREARLVARLNHPSIVTVFEIGRRADGALYSAQRLVRAEHGPASLREALSRTHTLEERLRLLPRLLHAFEAVGHAHARGVVHRDLKPEHIALGDDGETVVIDWGLAAHGDELTATKGPVGTRGYRSPEQEAGGAVDATSDVFSLGVILREVIDVQPGAPAPLIAVAARACHADSTQRYTTATALADELTRFLSGGVVRAHEYALSERAARAFRRHRVTVSLLGLVALVSIAAALVIARSRAQTREVLIAALLQKGELAQATGGTDEAALFGATARELSDLEPARLMLAANAGRSLLTARATAWPGEPVTVLSWSAASRRLAVASASGLVGLWTPGEPAPRALPVVHESAVAALAFSPDGAALYSVAQDGRFIRWDTKDGVATVLRVAPTELKALIISPDGTSAALGDERGGLELVTLPGGESRRRWQAHHVPVYALTTDPRGEWLASGTWSGEVATWTWTGEPLGVFRGHEDAVTRLEASPDGQLLASSSRDRTVRIWKPAAPGAPPMTLVGHTRRVTGVAWLDDRHVVSTADDGQVRNWALSVRDAGADEWQCLAIDQLGVAGLSLVAVEQSAIAGVDDGALFRVEAPRVLRTGMPWRDRISHLDTEDAGVLLAEGDFFVHRDLRSGALVDREPAGYRTWQVRTLHGGRRLWIGYDGPAEVVFVRDADGRDRELERGARLWSLLIDRDERWAGALGHRQEVTLHALDGGADLTLRGHDSDVFAAELGRTLAVTASYDTTVRVYELPSGEQRHVLRGHWHGVRAVALSGDELRIASGSWDRTVRVWDARTGALEATLRGHESYVSAVAFSPDGHWLASASWDGTLLVWDLERHVPVLRLDGIENEPRTLHWLGTAALLVGGSHFTRVELSPDAQSIDALARDRGLRLEGVAPRRSDFGVLLR